MTGVCPCIDGNAGGVDTGIATAFVGIGTGIATGVGDTIPCVVVPAAACVGICGVVVGVVPLNQWTMDVTVDRMMLEELVGSIGASAAAVGPSSVGRPIGAGGAVGVVVEKSGIAGIALDAGGLIDPNGSAVTPGIPLLPVGTVGAIMCGIPSVPAVATQLIGPSAEQCVPRRQSCFRTSIIGLPFASVPHVTSPTA